MVAKFTSNLLIVKTNLCNQIQHIYSPQKLFSFIIINTIKKYQSFVCDRKRKTKFRVTAPSACARVCLSTTRERFLSVTVLCVCVCV